MIERSKIRGMTADERKRFKSLLQEIGAITQEQNAEALEYHERDLAERARQKAAQPEVTAIQYAARPRRDVWY